MHPRAPLLGATLDNWLNRLDAEGFRIGIRERLIVQDFLARLAAQGELPEAPAVALKLIAPLICTTPESQRRYGELLKAFQAARPVRPRRGREGGASPGKGDAPARRWGRWLGLAILLVAVLAGIGWWQFRPETPATDLGEPLTYSGTPAASGPQALDVYTPTPSGHVVPAAPAESFSLIRLAAWLLAGLSALLLAHALWARLRRALYLQGTRTDAQVEEHVLTDPHAGQIEPQSAPIRAAARGLRQRIAGEREVLDLRATLAATLRAAGAFTARYRLLQHTPEYLALVDRRHPGDHLAAYCEALLKALAEHGVTVQVYSFEGSPEYGCWRLRQGSASRETFDRASITELAARYGGHRLLVFGEASALVDPLSGGVRHWAGQLGVFRQRAWFTPMPIASWGGAEEAADSQGFLVLPMPAETLTTLAGWFCSGDLALTAGADWPLAYPALLKDQGVAWVARQSMPPDEMLQELLFQLRAYLGAQRYQWLCACAIFPALSPTLTLALGKELSGDARELTLGMATLGALPWFRYGHMPAWLRQALLASLNPENEAHYRQVIEQRLASALEGSAGAELARVATRSKLLAWLSRGRGPARDVVLVDFLHKDTLSRLAQVLPEPLRRRLFRDGLAIHGLRPVMVVAVTGMFLVALGVGLFAPWLSTAQPPASVEKSRIDFIGCEDPLGVDLGTRAIVDMIDATNSNYPRRSGKAVSLALTAYAPGVWKKQHRQPAPATGEIRHATGNAEQKVLAEELQAWLKSNMPFPWAVRAAEPDLAAVTVNACPPAKMPPKVPQPLPEAPLPSATVYIHIGAEIQRPWALALVEKLRRIPAVTVHVQRVDVKRLPDRIEVRSRRDANPRFLKLIADELSGSLETPAVQKALELLRASKSDGNVYEIWASTRLCIGDLAPSCGPAPSANLANSGIAQGQAKVAAKDVPATGWCCIQAAQNIQRQQAVGVIPMGEKECASRNGVFSPDEQQALSVCRGQGSLPGGWEQVDVFEVQGLLARSGYYKGAMDGAVGDELTKALMLFQERSGLMPDGVPGPQTLSVLRGGFANTVPPAQRQFRK